MPMIRSKLKYDKVEEKRMRNRLDAFQAGRADSTRARGF